MGMRSYGRIAITNISRVGTLSVNPTCNMPLQVVYNPDSATYIPDWATNHLEIKPIVYFDGALLDSGYAVIFKKKDGSSTESTISATSGAEAVSNNTLIVSNNTLKDSNTGIITYLMEVSYTEPKTQVTLTSVAQLTFSLIKNSETVKYASITGENVFLYNTNQVIQGSDKITLEGRVTGVSISAWQYKNANGDWVNYPTTNNNPGGINGTSLVISESDSVFISDKATIKLSTTDSSVYDIITISKIRDGAAGGNSIAVVLSNDSHVIPADSDGNAYSYEGASTQVFVYEGGLDVTEDYDITYTVSHPGAMTVAVNQSSGVYSVESISNTIDSAWITFSCSKADSTTAPLTAKFTITKVKAGLDGENAVIYSLKPSTYAINKDEAGVMTPSKIAFQAKKRIGSASEVAYSGRFVIFETTVYNPEDNDWTEVVRSTADETVKQYTPSTSAKAIKCLLLPAGSTTNSEALDSQMVVITSDGATGEDGAPGVGGLNVMLGNESEMITCDTEGLVSEDQTITIPYTIYKGITKVAGTAEISGALPTGMTLVGITNASATASGVITIKATRGGNLGGPSVTKGEINILFTVDSVQDTKKFSWSKNIKAKDGINAVVFQSYTPNGNIIINRQNNVTIATMLVEGSNIIDSGVTYVWYKFDGSDYTVIGGETNSTLVVRPDMVDTMASFKCTATYNTKEYSTYYVVTDRSDPYEVVVYSSLGTQLVNNDKPGAIFVRVMQNGTEVDPIKSTVFGTTAPSGPSTGDFYYLLNSTARTCTLMKYNGSTWAAATGGDLPTLNYKFFKLDSTGNAVDITTPWKTGKAVYFDNQDTDPTLDLMVEVTD